MIVWPVIRRYSQGSLRMGLAMLRIASAAIALLGSLIVPASAQTSSSQDTARSECLAMANAPPHATPVSLRQAAAGTDEVDITYAGHSTYYIDTPGGVRVGPTGAAPTGWGGRLTSSP